MICSTRVMEGYVPVGAVLLDKSSNRTIPISLMFMGECTITPKPYNSADGIYKILGTGGGYVVIYGGEFVEYEDLLWKRED